MKELVTDLIFQNVPKGKKLQKNQKRIPQMIQIILLKKNKRKNYQKRESSEERKKF